MKSIVLRCLAVLLLLLVFGLVFFSHKAIYRFTYRFNTESLVEQTIERILIEKKLIQGDKE
jgi:hypothetical protein